MTNTRAPKQLRPKDRFQASDFAARHAETVVSQAFTAALEAAIAELTMRQPRPQSLEEACRAHYELLGARRFIDLLLNLAEPDAPDRTRPSDNLLWQLPQSQPQTHPQPPPPSPSPTPPSRPTRRAR